jgi:energy-converting hydrogenase Eha subunit H
MDFSTLGGNLLGTVPFGDIVLYFTPLNCCNVRVYLIDSCK